MLRLFEGPQCFFAFPPNLLSISPGEKCARSSRTRNRTPAGVGFSLDRVFVEGSAASIAAGFISAASAELVTPASTRPMTMHPEDACSLPCGGAGGSGLSRCRVPREGTDVRLRW
ncbi:hypothetical protein ACVWZV_001127 [Bradyrhizobium sp. GM5.1]